MERCYDAPADGGIGASELVRRARALANRADTEKVSLERCRQGDRHTAITRVNQTPDFVANVIGTNSAQWPGFSICRSMWKPTGDVCRLPLWGIRCDVSFILASYQEDAP